MTNGEIHKMKMNMVSEPRNHFSVGHGLHHEE